MKVAILIVMVALGTPMGKPDVKTGVEDTCDMQFDECMKMCMNDPQEIPEDECVFECKLDNDQCYRLP